MFFKGIVMGAGIAIGLLVLAYLAWETDDIEVEKKKVNTYHSKFNNGQNVKLGNKIVRIINAHFNETNKEEKEDIIETHYNVDYYFVRLANTKIIKVKEFELTNI